MMRINKELSERLAQRMYVDPGDEDYGQCFFNARRTLFRLTHLGIAEAAQCTEGYAVYLNYAAQVPYPCVAGHGWVTHQEQAIDTDYASFGRYDAAYFPGLQLSVAEIYQRLKISSPLDNRSAFGLIPMGVEMTSTPGHK